jgi:hypothetical protein
VIDVNYFCRLATMILAGPGVAEAATHQRPGDITTGRTVFGSSPSSSQR